MSSLSAFTPEQLAEIQELMRQGNLGPAVGLGQDGRSPWRPRQLTNLSDRPSATNPRPLFVPSAWPTTEMQESIHKQSDFPRLLWHEETHEEACAKSLAHMQVLQKQGYTLTAKPPDVELDPIAALEQELATWSEEDRQALFAEQRRLRMNKIQEKLANLNDGQLARVTGLPAAEAKRGPGRPKKLQTA